VTSDENSRVARRGPSWAPAVAAETRASSPAVSPLPSVSAARVVVERLPLRVAEAEGRSEPPAVVAGPQGERATADAGWVAPHPHCRCRAHRCQPAHQLASQTLLSPATPPHYRVRGRLRRLRGRVITVRLVVRCCGARRRSGRGRGGGGWCGWRRSGCGMWGSPRQMCGGRSWWRG